MSNDRKLKIVFVMKWHSANMGYANNCLPKAFMKLGHETHIVTTKYQSYYNHPKYKEIYEEFLGPNILPLGDYDEDGIKVHRIPSFKIKNTIVMSGLYKKLKSLQPDVIQTFDAYEIHTVKLSLFNRLLKYKLFTGNHSILISFRLLNGWNKLTFKRRMVLTLMFRWPAQIIARSAKMCYAVTKDSRMIATKLFGIPKDKVKVSILGVDTDVFYPVNDKNREEVKVFRETLGFSEEDIVCIFTGKIIDEKSPEVLAKAIQKLNEKGERFRAIYVGSGELKPEIEKYKDCKVVDFIPFHQLGKYYRAADIAVWPRSVTTSILDAAASGLPVVISEDVYAYDELENPQAKFENKPNIIARKYKTNDIDDLCLRLMEFKDRAYRKSLGAKAADLIEQNLSWNAIAQKRLEDYYNL